MTAMWEDDLDAVEPAVVHWSTSTILTIFFALSLIAALLFGLGFTFGPAQTAKFVASTPSGGGTTSSRESDLLAHTSSPATGANRNATQHASIKIPPENPKLQPVSATEHAQGLAPPERTAVPNRASQLSAVKRAADTQAVDNRYMVQVGAIGNRKDAQKLVSRLRRQGFRAGIYPGKRDKFLHVQLGPFVGTQQAQTVRRRVMAHGYHALLKPAS